jgi:hypothetical protein
MTRDSEGRSSCARKKIWWREDLYAVPGEIGVSNAATRMSQEGWKISLFREIVRGIGKVPSRI